MKKAPTYEELSLFKKIYEQRSLSKVASELNLPISSASHMLSKLRNALGDQLFVKTGIGVVPTPKADSLYPLIVSLLRSMENLIKPQTLDLAKAKDHIRIACADNAPFMLFPTLLANLIKVAPNLTLSFEPLNNKRMEELRKKDLDFIITPMENELPEGFFELPLAVNHYCLVCGLKNPLVGIEKKAYCGVPDEEVAKFSFIDICLDRTLFGAPSLRQLVAPTWANFKRSLITSYFLPCVPMMEVSDLVSVLPTPTAKLLERRFNIKTLKTETKLLKNKPRLIWHQVTHSDPLRQWLRSMIKSNIASTNVLP